MKPIVAKPVMPPPSSVTSSMSANESSSMWEDLARRADERSEQLEEMLKHIKMALAEERKTAGQVCAFCLSHTLCSCMMRSTDSHTGIFRDSARA